MLRTMEQKLSSESEHFNWHSNCEVWLLRPEDASLLSPLFRSGIKRISILRLITTLTHAADSCGITNAELESLLRVAYVASQKVKQADNETEEDHLMHVERTQDM